MSLKSVLALIALLTLVIHHTHAAELPQKLNVLLIFSDDLRPELGCYGHPTVKTPNIDGLAQSGVRFDRAYCQFPLCNPSRTSILTGRYPVQSGVLGNRTWFGADHPEIVSLPKLFRQNGYATLRSGKIFHGGIDDYEAWSEGGDQRTIAGVNRAPIPSLQTEKQRNSQIPEREQSAQSRSGRRSDSIIVIKEDGDEVGDGRVAGRAIDFLRQYKDEAFFLGCGFSKPHSPPEAPQRFFDLYNEKDVILPIDFASQPTAPAGIPRVSVRKNTDLFIDREASQEQAKEMTKAYWASLTWMDHNVGRVLSELDHLGLREKTIVVFLGDHGYHLGEIGRWSKAGSLFEVGARIPLIIDAPGAKANGKTSERIVEAIDLYRTLAELTGLQVPEGVAGHSLAPLLNDPASNWNHPAYTVWAEGNEINGTSIRTEKYRYARWDGPEGGPILFDVNADPHELHNLANDPKYSNTVRELDELVSRHRSGK